MRTAAAPGTVSLWTLFCIFFRIACTSFGGFMAIVSVMNNVIVERRKLIPHRDMLDGISLASILPGTMAVNLVAYVGYRLRGPAGAFVSAFAAVLPAFVFIVVLGIAYFRWGTLPAVSKIFLGFTPAVVALIAAAAWNMGRASIAGVREAVVAIGAATALKLIGGFFVTLGIVLVAGFLGWWWFRDRPSEVAAPREKRRFRKKKSPEASAKARFYFLAALPVTVAPLASFDPSILLKILTTFGGLSLILFGGHYVFIPIIQEVVVNGQGWVTQQEFVDAVALGQITPGPLMVSAAFIGLKVAGFPGAVAATIGIFTPSAVLMVACAGWFGRVKELTQMTAIMRGIRAAVVGMIVAAAIVVGETVALVWISGVIFAVTLIALLRFRVDAVWVIPLAGAIGYLVY